MQKKYLIGYAIVLASVNLKAEDLGLAGIDVTAPKGVYKSSYSSSATKTNTNIMDLPQTITIINQQQLNDQQITDMSKSVTYSPGIDVDQGEGNRDAFIIRGNKTSADLYLDGIKDDAEYYRDLYNIDQVDILMGANGILFGKGGSGGVINRVSKQATFDNTNNMTIQLGSFDSKRSTLDVNRKISDRLAARLNVMAEKGDSFVPGVNYEKQGINPVFTFLVDDQTTVRFGREFYHDQRIGYRGVPSKNGRPYNGNRSQYYGNSSMSPNEVTVNSTFIALEHNFSDYLNLKNTTRYTDYDKYYSNIYANSSVQSDSVTLSAYYDNTQRQNFFNQTDVTWNFDTADISHTLLTGMEIGTQDNRRYRLTDTDQVVSIHNPTGSAWNYGTYNRDKRTNISYRSVYAQDQIKFNDQHQIVIGFRHDDYETDFNLVAENSALVGDKFKINDRMISTRLGYIYNPSPEVSYYLSYSNSFQPRNGDQLDAISSSNANEDPEKFINYEVGTKWQINSKLFATVAIYQLNRERMQITDPNDSLNKIIVDGQRSRGVEISINGRLTDNYSIVGGWSFIDAEITKDQGSGSSLISAGTSLGNVAKNNFSLWNKYEFNSHWSFALGAIGRGNMYAATPTSSSSVNLPGWVRFDAATYLKIDNKTRLQLNIENIFDKTYYSSAHNVNNIMVGMPLNARLTLMHDF
jgi:catecholate siderophore receptor